MAGDTGDAMSVNDKKEAVWLAGIACLGPFARSCPVYSVTPSRWTSKQ